nr:PREDICTED: uncharacterized protein LOC109040488 isoform X1 [Bemisia tabaci]XP_018917656.1 PREDICTED: uncharacterized protein LOC109044404 isoform X1 [Bemisia tabaci]
MTSKGRHVYCLVPQCRNTKLSTPDKLFFNVPTGAVRKKWFSMVRRDPVSLTIPLWCCEDHFTPEDDVEDWYRYKFLKEHQMPIFRLRLKKGILPHKFDCQPNRKTCHAKAPRSLAAKKSRIAKQQVLGDITNQMHKKEETVQAMECGIENTLSENPSDIDAALDVSASLSQNVIEAEPKFKDVGIQCDDLWVRVVRYKCCRGTQTEATSEATNNNPHSSQFHEAEGTGDADVVALDLNASCSSNTSEQQSALDESVCSSAAETPSQSDVSFNLDALEIDQDHLEEEADEEYLEEEVIEEEFKGRISSVMNEVTLKYPKLFLGIDPVNLCIIDALEQFTNCSKRNICIVLRKIRLDEPIEMLAIYFGLCKSTISRILSKTFPLISQFMATLIRWPEKEIIRANVPFQFKARYSDVQCLLDCFEIHIQQLSDPEHQSLTWSEYKKNNTVKYLVSTTPDGFINFISKGYGGRASDSEIVSQSGLLDMLQKNTVVMADRGFKQIEVELHKRNCSLIRPPSVEGGVKMSKDEIKETKIIASLRIHVERVIGRLRGYALLDPRACFNHNFIGIIDHAVIIAAALSNLQGPHFL